MKFGDIKRFMTANYRVDVPLDSVALTLERYNKESGLELCPDFQRGHVWTEDQQIKYIEYILKQPNRDRSTEILFNCPDWRFGGRANIQCVDGLQRLTAIQRFLNNEIPAYGTLYKDYEDHPSMLCTIQFCVNDLKTREEVLEWYLELNSGGVVHTQEELDRVRKLLNEERRK